MRALVGKSPPSGTQAALEIPEMEVTRMTKSRAVLWILSRSLLASAAALTSSVVCTILGQAAVHAVSGQEALLHAIPGN